jgi:hypothetical protein
MLFVEALLLFSSNLLLIIELLSLLLSLWFVFGSILCALYVAICMNANSY